jgi:hypothetical protein
VRFDALELEVYDGGGRGLGRKGRNISMKEGRQTVKEEKKNEEEGEGRSEGRDKGRGEGAC